MMRLTRGIDLVLDHGQGGRLRCGLCDRFDLQQVPILLWVTLEGDPGVDSGLLVNVRDIKIAIQKALTDDDVYIHGCCELLDWARGVVQRAFGAYTVCRLEAAVSESLTVGWGLERNDMIHVTRKYEIAAAHRLHQPKWDDGVNEEAFGKCSNPKGHGHNYMIEITLRGKPDELTGAIINLSEMDAVVDQWILERFDHKHLNEDTEEFANTVATVENMVKIFWDLLAGKFGGAELCRVAVWETPHTFAEYFGPGAGPLRHGTMV